MLIHDRVRVAPRLICNHVYQELVIVLCNPIKRITRVPIESCLLRCLAEESTLLICAAYFIFKFVSATSFLIYNTELLIVMCIVQELNRAYINSVFK